MLGIQEVKKEAIRRAGDENERSGVKPITKVHVRGNKTRSTISTGSRTPLHLLAPPESEYHPRSASRR